MVIGQTMSDTIALAEASVAAAEARAAADPFRPSFHYRPPAQWMNDICGALWHEGWYHIFFQFNPFADRCDWRQVNSCWGHARSRDLVAWEHLPIAIAPSFDEGNVQCASGCAMHRADGTPMLFYGHTPQPREGVRPPRQQRAALPLDADLRTWRTLDIGLARGQSGVPIDIADHWTDMFAFRDAGRTFAIFKEARGLVVEAHNPALTRWQAVGHIEGIEGECPNFIKLQGRWLLLRSTYPMTYQVGTFDPQRVAFNPDGPAGIVDYAYGLAPGDSGGCTLRWQDTGVPVCRQGAPPAHSENRGFYASSTFADAAGRVLLLAWVGAFRAHGWNCCMSLPRELSLDAEGRLVQTPIQELAALRSHHAVLRPHTLSNVPLRMESLRGDTFEILADVELETAQSIQLSLRDESGQAGIVIRYDGQSLDANGTVLPQILSSTPQRIQLHLFYDKSVVELFVNGGRQTVTRVAYPPSHDLHVEIVASGGEARIEHFEGWRMMGVW